MEHDALAQLLFPNISETPDYYEAKYPSRNLDKNMMVTRFAPSPTGFVHMGSLYAAYINRLFANQTSGIFYLRIEDTDQKREVEQGVEKINDAFEYFNIKVDESITIGGNYGPYIQSKRKDIYQTYVKDLVRRGLAYPCFCSEEELTALRVKQEANKEKIGYYGKYAISRDLTIEDVKQKIDNGESYVIRLRTPKVSDDDKIECQDLIKGKILFPRNDIDIILLKSDGIPTYHLAHAIDDHLMHTTHVIRGDEWLSSLPIHLQLFYMLKFDAPKYIHVAPLTKKEGNSIRKLSKRKDPELAMSFYQELGIPIEAIKLYFATITNSNFEQWFNQNREADINAFKFTFDKMPVGGTLFDIDKLMNISKLYFSMKKSNELYDETLNYCQTYDIDFYNLLLNNKEYALKVFDIERNRVRPRKDIGSYKEVKDATWYMFDELFYSVNSYENTTKDDNFDYNIIDDYLKNYKITSDENEWYENVKNLAVKYGYAPDTKSYKLNPANYKGHVGNICEMLRLAITGQTMTPSLFEIEQVLGLDKIKLRIENFKKVLLRK